MDPGISGHRQLAGTLHHGPDWITLAKWRPQLARFSKCASPIAAVLRLTLQSRVHCDVTIQSCHSLSPALTCGLRGWCGATRPPAAARAAAASATASCRRLKAASVATPRGSSRGRRCAGIRACRSRWCSRLGCRPEQDAIFGLSTSRSDCQMVPGVAFLSMCIGARQAFRQPWKSECTLGFSCMAPRHARFLAHCEGIHGFRNFLTADAYLLQKPRQGGDAWRGCADWGCSPGLCASAAC